MQKRTMAFRLVYKVLRAPVGSVSKHGLSLVRPVFVVAQKLKVDVKAG